MAASAGAEVSAEKMVDLPTLGNPTIPQFNAILSSFKFGGKAGTGLAGRLKDFPGGAPPGLEIKKTASVGEISVPGHIIVGTLKTVKYLPIHLFFHSALEGVLNELYKVIKLFIDFGHLGFDAVVRSAVQFFPVNDNLMVRDLVIFDKLFEHLAHGNKAFR